MLQDNYRTFGEVMLQPILNFPFAILGLAGIIAALRKSPAKIDKLYKNRIMIKRIIASLMLIGLLYLMFKWQFFYLPWI